MSLPVLSNAMRYIRYGRNKAEAEKRLVTITLFDIPVRVNRIGNIVLVARTATGRVLGRTAFTATSRGTRRVSLVLSPARLVTGVITISARASGGEPVTLTRSAN